MAVQAKVNRSNGGIGASLENVVLYNSSPNSKVDTDSALQKEPNKTSLLQENASFITKLCWWEPSKDSLPVEFCQNSSIHGLSFIGKHKLHLSERIFWTIAFILGVVAAVLLINNVWQRYYQNPVIVTFQEKELDIDSIPFPSVSICNMNAFPKSGVRRLQRIARQYGTDESQEAREALKYVREICNSQQSFAKEFHYAHSRGNEDLFLGWNDTISKETENQMMQFLLKHTLPCDSLIRLCMFAQQHVDCGEIFKPLITDYGKCTVITFPSFGCTFNILPLPLLLNRYKSQMMSTSEEKEAASGSSLRWSDDELDMWSLWNYDKDGFILPNKSQQRPYRQKRAGLLNGLSILVDPNLNDWYCPISDSEGFRFLLHNPLEVPVINEFASLIKLNKEILIEVRPEMTNADDAIRAFPRESRNCYFPEERQLDFYGPYTGGNCFAECTALELEKHCNCTYFYMPRHENKGICNSDPESNDYNCTVNTKNCLLKTLKTQCAHCDPLCENIDYKFELTTAALQDPLKLWSDPNPKFFDTPPSWAKNKMSIVHIFLGTESIVPKLRTRLYETTDLIANTGGLLGLCLGVSVLSAIEVVYFLTLRLFWRICWKRRMTKRNHKKTLISFPKVARDPLLTKQSKASHASSIEIPLVHQPIN